jgi:hypothetical protein
MLELLLCSLLTIFPDYLYRRYRQGKRLGKEIHSIRCVRAEVEAATSRLLMSLTPARTPETQSRHRAAT